MTFFINVYQTSPSQHFLNPANINSAKINFFTQSKFESKKFGSAMKLKIFQQSISVIINTNILF